MCHVLELVNSRFRLLKDEKFDGNEAAVQLSAALAQLVDKFRGLDFPIKLASDTRPPHDAPAAPMDIDKVDKPSLPSASADVKLPEKPKPKADDKSPKVPTPKAKADIQSPKLSFADAAWKAAPHPQPLPRASNPFGAPASLVDLVRAFPNLPDDCILTMHRAAGGKNVSPGVWKPRMTTNRPT